MSLLADTSVWSLALRRNTPEQTLEVDALARALVRGQTVFTTGLVLQELLQGFAGPKARSQIIEKLSALPFLSPERDDHIEAAELRNHCRRSGVQVETVDVLLAQLCIRYDLILLTIDRDFAHIAKHSPLKLWKP
ncbi:MAG TPA: PIN domain-containing protein [Rhizomicrobium sp.]|nr:PIN domain-containing protein [Rhizomicrobium sp.]